jgi:multiple antibiotic resistance protein
VLLACVVLVDLASYITVALGASDAKWMNPLAEKIMTSLMGLLAAHRGTILV